MKFINSFTLAKLISVFADRHTDTLTAENHCHAAVHVSAGYTCNYVAQGEL